MVPLQIRTERRDDIHTVVLDGMVDATTVDLLRHELEPLCQAAAPRIVVDAALLTYANSLGFGLLFRLAQACRARGGRMIIAGLQDKLRVIFRVLGLEKWLEFAATRDEAVALMKRSAA